MVEYTPEEVEEERLITIEEFVQDEKLSEENILTRYINLYALHEVLRSTLIFQENVDSYLMNHPTIFLDPEAYRLAHAAATALFNLYQRIEFVGETMVDETDLGPDEADLV